MGDFRFLKKLKFRDVKIGGISNSRTEGNALKNLKKDRKSILNCFCPMVLNKNESRNKKKVRFMSV